jgi:hypothetical protein
LDETLKAVLSKGTAFKPVERMQGSRVSAEYVQYLSSLGLSEKAKAVSECKKHLIAQHCLGQHAHASWSFLFCREDKACVNEDMVENGWEMNDMELYLQLLFEHARVKRHVWYVDFTVGGDLKKKIPRDNLAEFAKLGYQVMQEYFRKKLVYDAEFGMDVAPQFWSSEEPGKGYRPHLHTIIPRVFMDRNTTRVLDIRMNRLGSEEDLSELKRMWRSKVESVYGKSRARVKGKYEEFSVKVMWRGEDWKPRFYRRSMRHRLKYMYRGIVFDVEKYIEKKEVRREQLDLSEWNSEFMKWALTTSHKRHIGYGLMSPKGRSARSRFMRSIGFDYGTRQERKKAMRKQCPVVEGDGVCGCYIHRWYGDEIMPLEKAQGQGLQAVIRRFDEEALTDVQRKYQRDYARS